MSGKRRRSPHQPFEGIGEVAERQIGVEGICTELPDRAIAAPVHGAGVDQAAQGLGRHRPLHRMKVLDVAGAVDLRNQELGGRTENDRDRALLDRAIRIPQIPGQAVEVAEDVAAGARRLAVGGGVYGVVEKGATLDHLGGLRVVELQVLHLGAAEKIDDRDRIVEAGEDVEPLPRLVEGETAGATAAHLEIGRACRSWVEAAVLEALGPKHSDLA